MRVSTKVVIDIESGEEFLREAYEYEGPVELCRGATNPAGAAAAGGITAAASNDAQQQQLMNQQLLAQNKTLEAPIVAGYEKLLKNPAIATPEGETAAAAYGSAQDALAARAARTGNTAGVIEGEDKLARDKAMTLSDVTRKNQVGALGGLASLYGTDTNLLSRALGIPAEYLNAGTGAVNAQTGALKEKKSWYDDMINTAISAGGQVGAAALGA